LNLRRGTHNIRGIPAKKIRAHCVNYEFYAAHVCVWGGGEGGEEGGGAMGGRVRRKGEEEG